MQGLKNATVFFDYSHLAPNPTSMRGLAMVDPCFVFLEGEGEGDNPASVKGWAWQCRLLNDVELSAPTHSLVPRFSHHRSVLDLIATRDTVSALIWAIQLNTT